MAAPFVIFESGQTDGGAIKTKTISTNINGVLKSITIPADADISQIENLNYSPPVSDLDTNQCQDNKSAEDEVEIVKCQLGKNTTWKDITKVTTAVTIHSNRIIASPNSANKSKAGAKRKAPIHIAPAPTYNCAGSRNLMNIVPGKKKTGISPASSTSTAVIVQPQISISGHEKGANGLPNFTMQQIPNTGPKVADGFTLKPTPSNGQLIPNGFPNFTLQPMTDKGEHRIQSSQNLTLPPAMSGGQQGARRPQIITVYSSPNSGQQGPLQMAGPTFQPGVYSFQQGAHGLQKLSLQSISRSGQQGPQGSNNISLQPVSDPGLQRAQLLSNTCLQPAIPGQNLHNVSSPLQAFPCPKNQKSDHNGLSAFVILPSKSPVLVRPTPPQTTPLNPSVCDPQQNVTYRNLPCQPRLLMQAPTGLPQVIQPNIMQGKGAPLPPPQINQLKRTPEKPLALDNSTGTSKRMVLVPIASTLANALTNPTGSQPRLYSPHPTLSGAFVPQSSMIIAPHNNGCQPLIVDPNSKLSCVPHTLLTTVSKTTCTTISPSVITTSSHVDGQSAEVKTEFPPSPVSQASTSSTSSSSSSSSSSAVVTLTNGMLTPGQSTIASTSLTSSLSSSPRSATVPAITSPRRDKSPSSAFGKSSGYVKIAPKPVVLPHQSEGTRAFMNCPLPGDEGATVKAKKMNAMVASSVANTELPPEVLRKIRSTSVAKLYSRVGFYKKKMPRRSCRPIILQRKRRQAVTKTDVQDQLLSDKLKVKSIGGKPLAQLLPKPVSDVLKINDKVLSEVDKATIGCTSDQMKPLNVVEHIPPISPTQHSSGDGREMVGQCFKLHARKCRPKYNLAELSDNSFDESPSPRKYRDSGNLISTCDGSFRSANTKTSDYDISTTENPLASWSNIVCELGTSPVTGGASENGFSRRAVSLQKNNLSSVGNEGRCYCEKLSVEDKNLNRSYGIKKCISIELGQLEPNVSTPIKEEERHIGSVSLQSLEVFHRGIDQLLEESVIRSLAVPSLKECIHVFEDGALLLKKELLSRNVSL